jgi:hypothetical protein
MLIAQAGYNDRTNGPSSLTLVGMTDTIDLLLTPTGQELLAHLAADPPTPENELRIITQLRKQYDPALVTAAVHQSRLRVRAREKFSRADEMYFTRDGLEQASTEWMAAHHAERFVAPGRMVEMCTGIGGDLIALARGRDVVAVDLDPLHLKLAQINADVYGVGSRVTTRLADVRDVSLDGVAAVFIDPARRIDGRRLKPGESEPPLAWATALATRVAAVGIKAGPTLPDELAPGGWELELVSERGELKEAMLWSPALATTTRRATVLPSGATMAYEADATIAVREPGAYLIDPDSAVTRASLVEQLAQSLGACWKIDARIAFLSSDTMLETPFGRTLAIQASMPWSLARLKSELRARNIGVVDIRKRGSAVDVDDLHRRLRLSGDQSATVVLTRVADKPWMLICSDPLRR